MHKVFKFGGASVKDSEAVINMVQIIREHYVKDEVLVVVVSAMGKTTNSLEEILYKCIDGFDYKNDLENIKKFHLNIIRGLQSANEQIIIDELEDFIFQLEKSLHSIKSESFISESEKYDRIVPFGELISTKILSNYFEDQDIQNCWLDARKFVITTNDFREGIIKWEKSEQNILNLKDQAALYLTQGFIGSTEDGRMSTLGREGSDFTAAIFGNILNAESITIWKDVPGILNADPKLFKDTALFENLSYTEASEMTYYGASVIHPKTIKPLANKNIPLIVKSFIKSNQDGTVISKEPAKKLLPVTILKRNQVLISFKVKDFTFINEEQIGLVFHALNENLIKINVMQNSAISLTIAIDNRRDKIDALIKNLEHAFDIDKIENLSLITIVNHEHKSISRIIDNYNVILEQRTLKTCQYIISGAVFEN
ncbi:aspartate kinase [Hyphobacterium sp. CCMP332]|nr:aspartate kinase [Hyphobacterium sp. CCMP332]